MALGYSYMLKKFMEPQTRRTSKHSICTQWSVFLACVYLLCMAKGVIWFDMDQQREMKLSSGEEKKVVAVWASREGGAGRVIDFKVIVLLF